jgi:hypothetical protein
MENFVTELTTFLRLAKKATYADVSAPKAPALRPQSEDYHFEQGEWAYHDTYFGTRDFIGQEIVYKNGKPMWGMNYYGHVLNPSISTQDAYVILRPALGQDHDAILPVRGPKEFVLGNSRNTNRAEGTLDRFSGEEKIYIDDRVVYRGWYHGGSVA